MGAELARTAQGAPSDLSAPVAGLQGLESDEALSLAFSRRNSEWVVRWSGCERRQTELRDAASTAVYIAGCGAWSCAVCGPEKAKAYAEAIAWGEPTTFGRLSLMPEDWERCKAQVRDLRRRLIVRYGPVEWAWVRHRNPKLTGYHVHFVGRMPWIPQRELQAMTGGRIPWITAAKQSLGSADYLLGVRSRRGASGYLLKRGASPEFWLDHMALNGGRGVHWSRGYFGGASVSDVLYELRRERRGGRGTHWYRPGSVRAPDWRKGSVQGPENIARLDVATGLQDGQTALNL